MKCKNCGREFTPLGTNAMKGYGLYCSKDCYFEFRRKQFASGNMSMGKKKHIYKFTCKQCGKEFERTGHDKHNNTFCSVECSQKFKVGKNHPHYNREGSHCTECGKEILVIPSRLEKKQRWGLFCSIDCKAKWVSRNIVLERSPQWKGGISYEPYCPLFNETFRERVRAFFDYTCQLCGSKQEDCNEHLHVHHIEYNKQTCCDNSPKMFVPLCRSCHTKTNHNRAMYQELFTKLITEKYHGRSYFTMEEWDKAHGKSPQSLSSQNSI